MPSPAGEPGEVPSPRGQQSGASTGAPEGSLSWASASPSSAADRGRRSASPSGGPVNGPFSPVGPNKAHYVPVEPEPLIGVSQGPPKGGSAGASVRGPLGNEDGVHIASLLPRVLGGPRNSLNLRGPRGASHVPPGSASAAASRGGYVHLPDTGSCSSTDEDEGGPPGSPFIGGSRGPRRAPRGWGLRLQGALLWLTVYFRLVVRRLSLALRFLLFWINDNDRQLKFLLFTATLLVSSTGNTIAFK